VVVIKTFFEKDEAPCGMHLMQALALKITGFDSIDITGFSPMAPSRNQKCIETQ
jgi:hypothetical protein